MHFPIFCVAIFFQLCQMFLGFFDAKVDSLNFSMLGDRLANVRSVVFLLSDLTPMGLKVYLSVLKSRNGFQYASNKKFRVNEFVCSFYLLKLMI